MLNGTLCATERALCCLVENYQTPDVSLRFLPSFLTCNFKTSLTSVCRGLRFLKYCAHICKDVISCRGLKSYPKGCTRNRFEKGAVGPKYLWYGVLRYGLKDMGIFVLMWIILLRANRDRYRKPWANESRIQDTIQICSWSVTQVRCTWKGMKVQQQSACEHIKSAPFPHKSYSVLFFVNLDPEENSTNLWLEVLWCAFAQVGVEVDYPSVVRIRSWIHSFLSNFLAELFRIFRPACSTIYLLYWFAQFRYQCSDMLASDSV